MENQFENQPGVLKVSPAYEKARHRVPVFESTVQKSKRWLTEMHEELEWMSASERYHLLRAVLHTLRDQLNTNECAQFAAQLPLLLKGTFYECWNPSIIPPRSMSKEEFILTVLRHMDLVRDPSFDLEHGIRVVMRVISSHVSAGEMHDVLGSLNMPLRNFLQSLS